MRISFDFDGVLGHNKILQKLAKSLIHAGHEVFILTSRHDNYHGNNEEFKGVVRIVGIKHDRIIFSPKIDKYIQIKEHKIDLHFDDDFMEIDMINEYCNSDKGMPGLFVGYKIPRHEE